jgi:hypothetical protein
LKGVPTAALAVVTLEIDGGCGVAIVKLTDNPALVPPALVAERTTLVVPAVDGVPLIRPVEVFNESPGGRAVAE